MHNAEPFGTVKQREVADGRQFARRQFARLLRTEVLLDVTCSQVDCRGKHAWCRAMSLSKPLYWMLA